MTQLDPRVNAFREDLAASYLKDKVRAPRYSDGEVRQVAAPSVPVRTAPRFDAPLATEALSGEFVTIYDTREGWAWVQLREDGYVGYTPLDGLSAMPEENTHRVSARLTYLYPAPDIKRPPITKLSFSCTVALIGRSEGRFFELSRGGYVFGDHLVGIKERAKDFVRVAERFVGVPYLWGGKTTLGIDCSGLVQIALQAAGAPCPRDSDMQLEHLGEAVDPSNLDGIQRGDLLFWKGHVAIAQSGDWMIHASGQHMEVVVEQIRRAVERIGESHGQLLAIKRLMPEQAAAAPKTAKVPPRSAGGRPESASRPATGPASGPTPAGAAQTQGQPPNQSEQPPASKPGPRSQRQPSQQPPAAKQEEGKAVGSDSPAGPPVQEATKTA